MSGTHGKKSNKNSRQRSTLWESAFVPCFQVPDLMFNVTVLSETIDRKTEMEKEQKISHNKSGIHEFSVTPLQGAKKWIHLAMMTNTLPPQIILHILNF